MKKLLKKFFDVHMSADVCPSAKEKLFKKILPELCIENDICPFCSEDLKVADDCNAAYMYSVKECEGCKGRFKGKKSYGRPNVESKTFIQKR